MQIFKQKNITKSYICLQIPQKSTNFAPKPGNLSKLTSYPGEITNTHFKPFKINRYGYKTTYKAHHIDGTF